MKQVNTLDELKDVIQQNINHIMLSLDAVAESYDDETGSNYGNAGGFIGAFIQADIDTENPLFSEYQTILNELGYSVNDETLIKWLLCK